MKKNTLYTANKWNQAAFLNNGEESTPEKDLFYAVNSQEPKEKKRNKDKLVTVNKWNQRAFTVDRVNNNIFDANTPGQSNQMNNAQGGWASLAAADKAANPWNYANDIDTTKQYMSQTNSFGISKEANPFSKGNLSGGIGGALKGIAGGATSGAAGLGAIGSAVGGAIGGLIGNGYQSGVGNALGAVGKMASIIPGPWGAAISGGLQILGGGVNALFGSKVDAARLGEANKEMSALNSFKSNATSFDAIKGATATKSVADIYKGGVFNSSAKKEQAALEAQMIAARQFADRSINNNISNIANDQMNLALANFSALGGMLTKRKSKKRV